MANPDEASDSAFVQRFYTVFIDTSLDTHLAMLVSDVDTVFDLKKRLLQEHLLCFPDIGDIKISAFKVKRRGHLYHLSDSMFVKMAFDGISKSWFLFVEVLRVEWESKNWQLQQIDSSKHIQCQASGVEPSSKSLCDIDGSGLSPEKDRHVKFKPLPNLSGADKQHPGDMETGKDASNIQDVPFLDTYSKPIENVAVDPQKDSTAAYHNSLDPEPLEKSKEYTMNSELTDVDNKEAKDVHENLTPEGTQQTVVTEKKKRKPKRKTRSLDNHEPEENHRPSHPSTLASASDTHPFISSNHDKASANVVCEGNIELDHPTNADPNEIEPFGGERENANTQDKSIEAAGDVTHNKEEADVREKAKLAKEHYTPQTPARKKRKTEKKPGKENSVAGNREPMLNTNEAFSPQSSLVDRQRVSDLDVNNLANDTLEASSGLTTTSTADKKKKRKKSSKDLNESAAATSSRDFVGGTGSHEVAVEGEPDAAVLTGKLDHPGVVSESCASLPKENLVDSRIVALEKEIERGQENVDDVGSGKAILSTADNLQTIDLTSEGKKKASGGAAGLEKELELPMKDDTAAMANRGDERINTDEAKSAKSSKGKKRSKKAKNPDQGTLVTSCAQHVEGPGTGSLSAEPIKPLDGEEPIEGGEKNVDGVGSGKSIPSALDNLQNADLASKGRKDANFDEVASLEKEGEAPMKDDAEAMANRDDGRTNTDEAKSAKSSKSKKKSKKAKNTDLGTLVTSYAQHVEGPGISLAEPIKPVDGEEPDSVIISVLESLRQQKEQENLEKIEKKSRKKTGKRKTLNVVDAQGLLVEDTEAAHKAAVAAGGNAKETDDSSKPSETIRESAEVTDSSQDTMLHKLNGNNEGKTSEQIEPSHEKEKVDVGDNFVPSQAEDNLIDNGKTQDQGAISARVDEGGAKSKRKKKVPDLRPSGSANGSRSATKPIEKHGGGEIAQPAGSSTGQQPSEVVNDSFVDLFNKKLERGLVTGTTDGVVTEKLDRNLKAGNVGKPKDSAARSHSKKAKEPSVAPNSSITSVRESSQTNTADRHRSNADQIHASSKGVSNTNNVKGAKSSGLHRVKNKPKDCERKLLPVSGSIFDDDKDWNSDDDESDTSGSSTKGPSDASSNGSDEDSDATFKSPPYGSRLSHDKESRGRKAMRSSGPKDMNLEKILRSSSRYKKAKLTASQYDDDSLPVDCVPDSQVN